MYKPLIAFLVSAGLAGLGAPLLRQAREIIKDFWFRNKKEATSLDLDNKRKSLEIDQEACGPVRPKFVVVIVVVNAVTGEVQKADPKLTMALGMRELIENLLEESAEGVQRYGERAQGEQSLEGGISPVRPPGPV